MAQRAVDAVFASPLAAAAIYRSGGDGDGVAVRVIVKTGEPVLPGLGAVTRQRRDGVVIEARAADVAVPAQSDTLTIGARTRTVRGVTMPDPDRLVWQFDCIAAP